MSHEELRQTFESLLRSSITTAQLTRLVNRSIRLATGLLKARYNRYLLILGDAGYSVEGAAGRCIEELFLTQDGIPCARLTEFIGKECNMDGRMLNGDCERILRRCIFLYVHQGIPDMLGEFDPQYKKILRMVSNTIAEDPDLWKQKGFLDDIVGRGDADAVRKHLPSMPPDEVLAELSRRASPDDSTQKLVGHLFDILDEQGDVRGTLPLGQIITILRDFFNLYWQFSCGDTEAAAEEPFELDDAERLITAVVEEISARLLDPYKERGMLAEEDYGPFHDAVRNLLRDLSTGSTARLFEYHQAAFPHISYEQYREQQRGRFEYVLGNAKELFLLHCWKYFRADFSAAG
jgi:hypothetical protein